ncbi:CUL1, partial [Symbiodinium sp. KB8]
DDYCDELAQHHQDKIQEYLRTTVVPALDAKHGDGLLEEFRRRWEDHKIYSEWMRKLFLYLDKHADDCSGAESRETTTSVALRYFKETVFDVKKGDIVSTIQEFVNKDRVGEAVDRSLLKSVVELFLVMGVAATKVDFKNKLDVEAAARDRTTGTNETYINDFETPFISNSQAIYRTMSTDWLSADSIPAYLVKVEDTLTREKARVDAYLNPSTWTKLRAALVEVMLRDRAVAIREAPTGLADMLESDRREDIGRMYRLFSLWEGGSAPVAAGIARFVRTAGEAIVRKRATKLGAPDGKQYAGEDHEFVEEIIALQTRFDTIIAECCESDPIFRKEVQGALNVIINTNARGESDAHPTGELIAAFVDMIMRGKRKDTKIGETAISAAIVEVNELLNLLNDRDLFQESHRTLLARRLLGESSFSNESEREFIGKLKESRGPSYTNKFEGMLTDLASPDDVSREFAARGKSDFDLEVKTLCHGHWPPPFQTTSVTLPPLLRSATDDFVALYRSKQSSRKVDFALAEGTMTVRGFFSKGGKDAWYDFRCNTLQGLHLLHFNASETWKCADLASAVGVSPADCAQLIKPYVFSSSCRVIIDQTLADDHKAGKKIRKVIEPEHTLVFNGRFVSKRKLVTVPEVQLKETANKAAIDVGRKHVLDAAIVRIMKTRKTMKLQALVLETEAQARRMFAPDPRLTKKRIEHLIEQDYMERDEADHGLLHYVA